MFAKFRSYATTTFIIHRWFPDRIGDNAPNDEAEKKTFRVQPPWLFPKSTT